MTPKIAILVGAYPEPSETFIQRHVEHLFGGNTVLVCRFLLNSKFIEKPVFACGLDYNNHPFWECFQDCIHRTTSLLLTGYANTPLGKRKSLLKSYLVEHRVQCILAEFGILAGSLVSIAKELNIPIFAYFRGHDVSRVLANRHSRYFIKRTFGQLSGIFAVSLYLVEKLYQAGLNHPNTHVLPSGVDTSLFKPGDKDPNMLLSVGRFVPKKNPLLTVRAMARVLKNFPEARLEMIGDGPLLQPSMNLAKELGICKKITFLGVQQHQVVRQKLANASIFVQHSVMDKNGNTEGLPSAIQESMSSGAAVIATNHAGIPEIISSGFNGLLVAENDLDAYVDNICNLLADQSLCSELAANARQTALEKLDCWVLQAKLEDIIRKDVYKNNAQE